MKNEKILNRSTKHISKKAIIAGGIIAVFALIFIGIGTSYRTDSKTTTLGLRNIGELATQSAYVTEVGVIDDPRTLFKKVKIPFTQSRYIYSYDFIVKAGFKVKDIIPDVDDEAKTVNITMPKSEILSNEPKLDSLKIYLEDESIFNQVTMDETNQEFIKMQQNAQQDAIANGLLESAEENAKSVITGLFSNQWNPDEYAYNFEFK